MNDPYLGSTYNPVIVLDPRQIYPSVPFNVNELSPNFCEVNCLEFHLFLSRGFKIYWKS